MTMFAGPPVFPQYFVDPLGKPMRSVKITVYERGTETKPNLYADREKSTPIGNPFWASSFGNAEFRVDAVGEFEAEVNGERIPFTVVADPEEPVTVAAGAIEDALAAFGGVVTKDDLTAATSVLTEVDADLLAEIVSVVNAVETKADAAATAAALAAKADAAATAAALAGKQPTIPPGTFVQTPGGSPVTAGTIVTRNASEFVQPRGSGVARFIDRAKAGATLKIVGAGDSVTGGTGATLGTNDFLTLVRDSVAAAFPTATVTRSNRGSSGTTVATHVINGVFANAIADAGDLYILMFAKNDTVADAAAVPRQGYPVANSIRGLEIMVREIRRLVPKADIIIASEPPNAATDVAANGYLQAWNAEARQIAAAYACEWVDVYAAYTALGNYSSYLSDNVHPSVTGHALIADTILASIPTANAVVPLAPGKPGEGGGVKAVADIKADTGFNGWRVLSTTDAAVDGVWVNSGTWTGPNPFATSTVNDYAEFTFVGTEFMARFSTASADALVVDIVVDGVTTHTNLNLAALPSNFQPWLLIASGLSRFKHTVRITLKSGTMKIYQAAWLVADTAETSRRAPRKLVSGRYHGQQFYRAAAFALASGTAAVVPVFVPRVMSINQLAVDVTALAAGATVALGIYGSDEYDQPLGLILDGGTIDAGSTGFKTVTISLALQPGWHWLAALALGGSPTLRSNLTAHDLVTTASPSTASELNGYLATGQTALPKRWTSIVAGAVSPRILMRAT